MIGIPFDGNEAIFGLLAIWIMLATCGVLLNGYSYILSVEDRAFLRAKRINGARQLIVEMHLSDAYEGFVFKIIYGLVGVWTLLLRLSNPQPLSITGWIVFGALFIPLAWRTVKDVLNHRKRRDIVRFAVRQTLQTETVYEPVATKDNV